MTTEEFQKIVADALKPVGDRLTSLETRLPASATAAAAKSGTDSPDLAKQIGDAVAASMKPLTDRFEKSEKDAKQAQARAAVDPHIKRGAIAPQDTDAIALWEGAWIANAKSAEAQMAKLPGAKAGARLTKSAQVEDVAGENGEPVDQVVALAEAAMAKNPKLSRADALIAAATSDAGGKQYQEFRAGFAAVGVKRN